MANRPEKFDVVVSAVVRSGPRVLLTRLTDHDYWFLPGGPVQLGESAKDALHRDILDELGLEANVADLVAVVENAFVLDGVAHHEINLAFEVRVDRARSDALVPGMEFRWFDAEALYDVDIRPASLATVVRYGPEAARLPLHSHGLGR
ncbi:NUDIX hydrolase [Arsenicicoccus sp. oral taxon 190]|uniref:NUDIX hydrolase n=1 Tax=Arsenicicoccus sp. oral taxon 190 TaxID=1658671 RepID=UPI00067BAFDC|nr:NUDIX domain-containing protein [Arsenicicoccus sp. oral taxon 190]